MLIVSTCRTRTIVSTGPWHDWHVTPAPKRLPTTKAGLYRAAVDLLLWRWTRPKQPDPAVIVAIGVDPPALRPVLEALACKPLAQQGEDCPLAGMLALLE